MSLNSSENIISIFGNSKVVGTHDDPLHELLTEFADLSDDVSDELEETETVLQCASSIDLSMLSDEQLYEFIQSRVDRLQELKKRLHYFTAEISNYIE